MAEDRIVRGQMDDSRRDITTRRGFLRNGAYVALGALGYAVGRKIFDSLHLQLPRISNVLVYQIGPEIDFVIMDTETIVLNDNAQEKSIGDGLNPGYKYLRIYLDGKSIDTVASSLLNTQRIRHVSLEGLTRVSPHEVGGAMATSTGEPVLSPGMHSIMIKYSTRHTAPYNQTGTVINSSTSLIEIK